MLKINMQVFTVGLIIATQLSLLAEDWNQYRGPQHNGVSSELISRWTANGPKQFWKAPVTDGFSSITVSGNRAFTLVARSIEGVKREVCVALDAETGKEVWATPLVVAKYDNGGDSGTPENSGGDGPRSTPAVDGNRVYVLDGKLQLSCFDVATGKLIWTRDLVKDHAAKLISWQNAASPVIEGDLVYVVGGGSTQSLLGINKVTGETIWKTETAAMTHASPVPATIHGVRQIIFFTQAGLISTDPAGRVLWKHPFRYNVSTGASPVVDGDIVYCSAGYGVGSTAVRVSHQGDGWQVAELWRITGNKIANHWSTPVAKDGYLYGLFGFKEYGNCPLKCVELATGKEIWSEEGFGPGNLIRSGEQLLVLGDRGQLVLAEASPKEYKELARAQVLAGKCWSSPGLSNGRLYLRSTREAVCLDVSGKLSKK